MFGINDNSTTTLTDRKIGTSNEGARINLDQLDEVLKTYASDPACAAVLGATAALRIAAEFTDATNAKAIEILKRHSEAVQTASEVAQAAVPDHGHHSPNERVSAIAAAGETIAAAFWRKAVAEVVAARQARADRICDQAVVAIEGAKLKIASARAKLAMPLTLRMKVDADLKALIDQLASELEHEKPSAIEQLVKTFQAVSDEENATFVLMATAPRIAGFLSRPETLQRFRISGNAEIEGAAAARLKALLENARRAEIPQSLKEAEAGYARLFPIFGSIFGRRIVTPENLRADPNWLTLALGKAPSGFGR